MTIHYQLLCAALDLHFHLLEGRKHVSLVNAGGNYYVVDIGDGSANNLNNWRIDANKIRGTLLTHLHSDHISDLADLHLMTWVNSAHTKPLDVYGPQGVELVTQGFEDAYQLDYQFRHEHHGDEVGAKGYRWV